MIIGSNHHPGLKTGTLNSVIIQKLDTGGDNLADMSRHPIADIMLDKVLKVCQRISHPNLTGCNTHGYDITRIKDI